MLGARSGLGSPATGRGHYRHDVFSLYRYAMTFEEFVPAFSSWFAGNRCGVAVLTGVRADESLNRFMGLVSQRKPRYADDKPPDHSVT